MLTPQPGASPCPGLTWTTLLPPAQPRPPTVAGVSCSPPTPHPHEGEGWQGDTALYRCQAKPCPCSEDRGPSCPHPLLHQPRFKSLFSLTPLFFPSLLPHLPLPAATGSLSCMKRGGCAQGEAPTV